MTRLALLLVAACASKDAPSAPARPGPIDVPLGPPRPLPGDKHGVLTVKSGLLPLPLAPMAVSTIGDEGRYGEDYLFVAFDLDRDGAMDLKTLDAPEQLHVFEHAVTLDGIGYAFSIAPDGARITLTPTDKPLPPRPTLQVGTKAPEVAPLTALRGKVVLLDFWATSCQPCIEAMPRLAKMRETHAPRGFEILSVAMPSDDVKDVIAAHPYGVQLVDTDDAVQTAFRVDRFPMYFLIARDGTIACSRCSLDAIEKKLPSVL